MVKGKGLKVLKVCKLVKLLENQSKFECIFEKFKTIRKAKVKKDTLSARIIRAIKRIYRSIGNDKQPTKTCIKIDYLYKSAEEAWSKFCELYRANEEFLKEISQVKNGPVYNKAGEIIQTSPVKSFNSTYCKKFFEPKVIQKSYLLILKLLFRSDNKEDRCKNLGIYCCYKEIHDDKCTQIWSELEEYMKKNFLSNLGITNPIREDFVDEELKLDQINPLF